MIHGIDADFIVAVEILDHPLHREADALLEQLLDGGHEFALAPQVLAKFIHAVTDPQRMSQPLTMSDAVGRAEHWWLAEEVVHLFPNAHAMSHFLSWLRQPEMAREQLLETLLAATFREARIRRLIVADASGFQVLG